MDFIQFLDIVPFKFGAKITSHTIWPVLIAHAFAASAASGLLDQLLAREQLVF